ncbi:OmpA family protein [Flavobacterium sp.]|uniref:OmpA family protein n=1 Tax=Flavobacterium sp. TaxID=239 RepID=UPI003752CC2F
MTKKTSYLLGILLTIVFGTFLYQKYCCNCCKEETFKTAKDSVYVGSETDISLNKFKLNGEGFDYQTNDNFNFLKDNFKTVIPVSDSINIGIDNLKAFFDKNPNLKLMVTGYATSDEKNTSAYPNLGFARANDVKNYFVSKGFSASKFDTTGEIRDAWKMSSDTLLGPVDYKLFAVEATSEKTDWNAMKTKINANPLILYFNTGQADINLTEEERQKVADLVNYLDNVSGAKLDAVGHTDNVGDRTINTRLGLERANFAKDYLVKNGVGNDKIETSSKGPDEPLADNNTADGKAKNRRTVVTIK